jgi:predicted nucleic acid-binding protein
VVLVDSSVWISLLSKKPKWQLTPDQLLQIATCPPVIQEILQGFTDERNYQDFKANFLSLPRYGDPIDNSIFVKAAELYRRGRKKGLTIRSSVDCLIAAIAIEHNVCVWHDDRDFKTIARFSALEQTQKIR